MVVTDWVQSYLKFHFVKVEQRNLCLSEAKRFSKATVRSKTFTKNLIFLIRFQKSFSGGKAKGLCDFLLLCVFVTV
jgi:hypothetical protein